jgi:heat shock protein HspQ
MVTEQSVKSNLADNTANEWYITGVQLEVGTSATPFEFLPYDVNLKRCRRYYHVPINTENKDYQEILEWVAEGNTITDNGGAE